MAKAKESPIGATVAVADGRLLDLLRATNKSDPKPADVEALRRYLEVNPIPWDSSGTFASIALERALSGSTGSAAVVEMGRASVAAMKRELGYDTSPAIERLLIDAIALASVNYHRVAIAREGAMKGAPTRGDVTFWDRRLTTAEGQYLRALEVLARVRRMKLPPLQVNIGGRQEIHTTNTLR